MHHDRHISPLLRTVAALAVGLFLSGGMIAAAQDAKALANLRTPWWQDQAKQKTLALTAEQVEAIDIIEREATQRRMEVMAERRKAYQGLVRLLDREDYSPVELAEKQEALAAAASAEVDATVDRWSSLREVITVDQWKALPTVAPRVMMVAGMGVAARGRVTVDPPDEDGSDGTAPSAAMPRKQ